MKSIFELSSLQLLITVQFLPFLSTLNLVSKQWLKLFNSNWKKLFYSRWKHLRNIDKIELSYLTSILYAKLIQLPFYYEHCELTQKQIKWKFAFQIYRKRSFWVQEAQNGVGKF